MNNKMITRTLSHYYNPKIHDNIYMESNEHHEKKYNYPLNKILKHKTYKFPKKSIK